MQPNATLLRLSGLEAEGSTFRDGFEGSFLRQRQLLDDRLQIIRGAISQLDVEAREETLHRTRALLDVRDSLQARIAGMQRQLTAKLEALSSKVSAAYAAHSERYARIAQSVREEVAKRGEDIEGFKAEIAGEVRVLRQQLDEEAAGQGAEAETAVARFSDAVLGYAQRIQTQGGLIGDRVRELAESFAEMDERRSAVLEEVRRGIFDSFNRLQGLLDEETRARAAGDEAVAQNLEAILGDLQGTILDATRALC